MAPIIRSETSVVLLDQTQRTTRKLAGLLHLADLGRDTVTEKNYFPDATNFIKGLNDKDVILFFLGSFGFGSQESMGLFTQIRDIVGHSSFIISDINGSDLVVPTHTVATPGYMYHLKRYLQEQ